MLRHIQITKIYLRKYELSSKLVQVNVCVPLEKFTISTPRWILNLGLAQSYENFNFRAQVIEHAYQV